MRFVVGYEDSSVTKDALEQTVKHAKAFGAEIHVVTSLKGGDETEGEDVQKAEQALEAVDASLKAKGIACETHLLVRSQAPGEDLVKYARDAKADLLFIGIKRQSKVGKLLFGSNAQYVILNAHCPVVTVR